MFHLHKVYTKCCVLLWPGAWAFMKFQEKKKGYTPLSPVIHSQSYSPLSPFAIVLSLGLKLQVRLKEVLVCSQPPPYILSFPFYDNIHNVIFSGTHQARMLECWKSSLFVSKLLVPTKWYLLPLTIFLLFSCCRGPQQWFHAITVYLKWAGGSHSKM